MHVLDADNTDAVVENGFEEIFAGRIGAVANNEVKVGDLFATLYRGLGIDPATQIRDPIGRPFAIAGSGGRPIAALF